MYNKTLLRCVQRMQQRNTINQFVANACRGLHTGQWRGDVGLGGQSGNRYCVEQSEERVALVLPYYCMKFE